MKAWRRRTKGFIEDNLHSVRSMSTWARRPTLAKLPRAQYHPHEGPFRAPTGLRKVADGPGGRGTIHRRAGESSDAAATPGHLPRANASAAYGKVEERLKSRQLGVGRCLTAVRQ